MLIARQKTQKKRVVANCLATDVVGNLVSITGPEVGGLWQVAKTQVDALGTVPAVGVIVNKINATTAIVQIDGELLGVFSGLTPGKVYYIDTNGVPSVTPPVPTFGMPRVYIQTMGVATDTDAILLKISPQMSVRVL